VADAGTRGLFLTGAFIGPELAAAAVQAGRLNGNAGTEARWMKKKCFIDATLVMAEGGGTEVGITKRGMGMKVMAIVDRHGLPRDPSSLSALLLQAFYGIRSERQLMELLDYN
jgi:hypothetical protein